VFDEGKGGVALEPIAAETYPNWEFGDVSKEETFKVRPRIQRNYPCKENRERAPERRRNMGLREDWQELRLEAEWA
jgi:hypothetical protein